MPALRIAAALIVKDEQANLPGCLESLQGLVDEVVVYDTGSSDDTVEIALRAGARVERGHWDGDFARARNAALAMTSAAWVLSIDADERAVADPGRCTPCSTVRAALPARTWWRCGSGTKPRPSSVGRSSPPRRGCSAARP